MSIQKEKLNIVMLMSLPTSGALVQWQETILQSTAEFSLQTIIIAPYSKEQCQLTIDLFKKYDNFIGFYYIDCTNLLTIRHKVNTLINMCSSYDVKKFITCFNPIINDREVLLKTIDDGFKKYSVNVEEQIEHDNYNIIQSSLVVKEFAEIIQEKRPDLDVHYHHLMYDPAELHLNEILSYTSNPQYSITHFIHDIPTIPNLYVDPFIVYSFANKLLELRLSHNSKLQNIRRFKSFDFIFGLTAFSEERRSLVYQLKDSKINNSSKCRFYYYYTDDNGHKIDTRVDYNEYLRQLNTSKSTLVIPAYKDDITFSAHRFIESIAQCCIPIVYKANYKTAFGHDKELMSIIKEHLFIDDISKLDAKVKYVNENYGRILRLLLNSNYIYTLSTTSKFKQATQLMLNID